MWKIVFYSIPLLLLFSPLLSWAENKTDNLHSAKLKYPYSLIGDDFGVLQQDDLALNQCEAPPEIFSLKSHSFPYWQCFLVETAKVICDGNGYDSDEKSRMTLLVFILNKDNETHEYLSSRAIHLSDCQSFLKDWKHLTKNEKYVCLSGPFISKSDSKNKSSWVFNNFKTRKGCKSYFVGGCDLQYQMRQGCN